MKVITIGRGEDNQIVLEDNQDLISRQHATLRIHETGKMEIVSTGSNGTFVNGFRIKSNVPYKVTRKDVISFAHVLGFSARPIPFYPYGDNRGGDCNSCKYRYFVVAGKEARTTYRA